MAGGDGCRRGRAGHAEAAAVRDLQLRRDGRGLQVLARARVSCLHAIVNHLCGGAQARGHGDARLGRHGRVNAAHTSAVAHRTVYQ